MRRNCIYAFIIEKDLMIGQLKIKNRSFQAISLPFGKYAKPEILP